MEVEGYVKTLRDALSKKDWCTDYAQKTSQFREKFAQSGVQRTKGAGGTVSALRRTQTRCLRMANILRATISPAGHALIHGSVAITVDLEANKNMLNNLLQKHKWKMFNVQHHPWVNMDHNNSVEAYFSWQDTRHSHFIEQQIKKEKENRAPLNNKELQNMKQLVRMRLRARLRRDALTTLCIDMSNDGEKRYGSDYIVLSAITYRKMPSDVQAEVNSSAFNAQRVLDIVAAARERLEKFFLSKEGAHIEHRIRTVPSSKTTSFFDQVTYFENGIMERISDAVKLGLMGASAIRAVFPMEKEGDENQCQRAFGHWLMKELTNMFGADFVNEYKAFVGTHGGAPELRQLFSELLIRVEEMLKDFNEAIVAAEALAVEENNGTGILIKRPAREEKKLKMEDVDDRLGMRDGVLSPQEYRTELEVLGEMQADKKKRKFSAADATVPFPNASEWRTPFQSTLAPVQPSLCQIEAVQEIVRDLGVLEALQERCLRRTGLEVAVGQEIIRTATNATTGSVKKKKLTENEARDVGVDSRRMLNSTSMKPIPYKDYIQHTDENGNISVVFGDRESSRFLVDEFDTSIMLEDDDEMRNISLETQDTANRMRFIFTEGNLAVKGAQDVVNALRQSRTPLNTNTETNYALMRSEKVKEVSTQLIVNALTCYSRMMRWKKVRKPRKSNKK